MLHFLPTGELTEEGYRKKLARLENDYGHSSHTQISTVDSIADLTSPNSSAVREKIKQLFGKKRPETSLSLKTAPHAKKPKCASQHRKKITVTCVDDQIFSIPSRKMRDSIVKQGLVKEMYVSKNEIVVDAFERLKGLFPNHKLTLLRVTASKDLIPVDPIQEESLIGLVDASDNIYVRSEKFNVSKKPSQSEYSLNMGVSNNSTHQNVILQGPQPSVTVNTTTSQPLTPGQVLAKVIETPQFNKGTYVCVYIYI